MNGHIAVESMPGRGSIFRVTVPLPCTPGIDDQRFTPPDLSGQAVLIAAPASVAAAALARKLTRWGAAATLGDARVAAAAVAAQPWNAVMIDLALGDAQAEHLARAAHDTSRRIVLINPTDRPRLAALKEAGFTSYLIKPVRASSLKTQLADDGATMAPETTATAAPVNTPQQRRPLAILVAEDNDINALLTRTLLTRLGHRPTMVADGAAALASWQTARETGAPTDLVLMDIHMPDMDGLEAARRLRATEAERGWPRTPIVALTANAFDEDRGACLAAGMDGFVVKPLDRERLNAALSAFLGETGAAA
jgi:CheY-like chemotaxis protein